MAKATRLVRFPGRAVRTAQCDRRESTRSARERIGASASADAEIKPKGFPQDPTLARLGRRGENRRNKTHNGAQSAPSYMIDSCVFVRIVAPCSATEAPQLYKGDGSPQGTIPFSCFGPYLAVEKSAFWRFAKTSATAALASSTLIGPSSVTCTVALPAQATPLSLTLGTTIGPTRAA